MHTTIAAVSGLLLAVSIITFIGLGIEQEVRAADRERKNIARRKYARRHRPLYDEAPYSVWSAEVGQELSKPLMPPTEYPKVGAAR